jgi:Heterokaryon incompatibility protein (HET)
VVSIKINGQQFRITPNLETALR